MAKRLENMSRIELQQEMSIAGNPEKITGLFSEMHDLMAKTVDANNAAELINMNLALDRLKAEVKIWRNLLAKKSGQQIKL
ncbi:MAG TPA: hypothetical protein VD794_03860 [Flavisolibacter sp.]|nr:hypothetical protein [Flavisolibacter sp.]